MIIPENSVLKTEETAIGDKVMSVLRCTPYQSKGIIQVKGLGGMTEVTMFRTKLAPGVSTREIHIFNVESGALPPDELTTEKRKTESERVSVARSISAVRELVACNNWDWFGTITLSPEKWPDRYEPVGLQEAVKALATKWRRKQVCGEHPYRDYKYLFVPEMHQDGAIHLHGVVNLIPEESYIPYTMADVESDRALPEYICDAVRAGKQIGHCKEWDEVFGFNVLEPIIDTDRAANYITKYVTKDLGTAVFKTRYWSSRGLKRASVVAEFQMPPGETALREYNDLLIPYAAVTSEGEILHREYYRPSQGEGDTDTLAGIKTVIDGERLSTKGVVDLLGEHYPTTASLSEARNNSKNMNSTSIKEAEQAHVVMVKKAKDDRLDDDAAEQVDKTELVYVLAQLTSAVEAINSLLHKTKGMVVTNER